MWTSKTCEGANAASPGVYYSVATQKIDSASSRQSRSVEAGMESPYALLGELTP